MKLHQYYVYILTNVNNTVLYTGVTNDLVRRVFLSTGKRLYKTLSLNTIFPN